MLDHYRAATGWRMRILVTGSTGFIGPHLGPGWRGPARSLACELPRNVGSEEADDSSGGAHNAGRHLVCQAPVRAYNIATRSPTAILELARAVQRITGSTSEIVEDYSHSEPGGLVASIDRAHRELHYQPRVRLEEGLPTYVGRLSAQPE